MSQNHLRQLVLHPAAFVWRKRRREREWEEERELREEERELREEGKRKK